MTTFIDSGAHLQNFEQQSLNIPALKGENKIQEAVREALADLPSLTDDSKSLSTNRSDSDSGNSNNDQPLVVEIHLSAEEELLAPLLQSQNSPESREKKEQALLWNTAGQLAKKIGRGDIFLLQEGAYSSQLPLTQHAIKKISCDHQKKLRKQQLREKLQKYGAVPLHFSAGRLVFPELVQQSAEAKHYLCMDAAQQFYLLLDEIDSKQKTVMIKVTCVAAINIQDNLPIQISELYEYVPGAKKLFLEALHKEHTVQPVKVNLQSCVPETLEGWPICRTSEGVVQAIGFTLGDSRQKQLNLLRKLKSRGINLKAVNILFGNSLFNNCENAYDYYQKLKTQVVP